MQQGIEGKLCGFSNFKRRWREAEQPGKRCGTRLGSWHIALAHLTASPDDLGP